VRVLTLLRRVLTLLRRVFTLLRRVLTLLRRVLTLLRCVLTLLRRVLTLLRCEDCEKHLHQLHVCLPARPGHTRLLYRMSLDFMGWVKFIPGIQKVEHPTPPFGNPRVERRLKGAWSSDGHLRESHNTQSGSPLPSQTSRPLYRSLELRWAPTTVSQHSERQLLPSPLPDLSPPVAWIDGQWADACVDIVYGGG
jgi:hypothetical protein